MSCNGYTNYETWSVSLLLDNDQYTADWLEEKATIAVQEDSDAYDFGRTIREFVEQELDAYLTDHSWGGMLASQLLGASLSDVNWEEIASNAMAFARDNGVKPASEWLETEGDTDETE